jgi:hypothetical protein
LANLGLATLISDPVVFFRSSCCLKMSGFYTGKGKGKNMNPVEEKVIKPEQNSSEADNDEQLRQAIALSLQKNKYGESSKTQLPIDDTPVKDNTYEAIVGYTKIWKDLDDKFKNVANDHNELKMKLDKQTSINPSDLKKLEEHLDNSKKLRVQREVFEDKLSIYGVNPSEQFYELSNKDTDSDYSVYSSDNSESRPKKRVKHLNSNQDFYSPLVFAISKVLNITFIMRVLSAVASAVFLLAIQLAIFPNFTLPIFDISITQLLTIYLTVNFARLLYKSYKTALTIYRLYLDKDYLIVYSNIYFSILIFLLYSCTNDIYVFLL